MYVNLLFTIVICKNYVAEMKSVMRITRQTSFTVYIQKKERASSVPG